MRTRFVATLAAPLMAFGLAACTVKEEDDGIEVEPADVRIEWDTTQVRTPDIDVIPRDTTTTRDTLPTPPR